jgi:type III secretion system low calcium response chaperone LcrH/SycD
MSETMASSPLTGGSVPVGTGRPQVSSEGALTHNFPVSQIVEPGSETNEMALLEEAFDEGTPKELPDLSGQDVEAAYATGFTLYGYGKYGDALPMFEYACLENGSDPRYWKALGSCYQMLKDYEAALIAYGYGAALDGTDPWPAIHMAVCSLALSRKNDAAGMLSEAENRLASGMADDVASRRIAALRQVL